MNPSSSSAQGAGSTWDRQLVALEHPPCESTSETFVNIEQQAVIQTCLSRQGSRCVAVLGARGSNMMQLQNCALFVDEGEDECLSSKIDAQQLRVKQQILVGDRPAATQAVPPLSTLWQLMGKRRHAMHLPVPL